MLLEAVRVALLSLLLSAAPVVITGGTPFPLAMAVMALATPSPDAEPLMPLPVALVDAATCCVEDAEASPDEALATAEVGPAEATGKMNNPPGPVWVLPLAELAVALPLFAPLAASILPTVPDTLLVPDCPVAEARPLLLFAVPLMEAVLPLDCRSVAPLLPPVLAAPVIIVPAVLLPLRLIALPTPSPVASPLAARPLAALTPAMPWTLEASAEPLWALAVLFGPLALAFPLLAPPAASIGPAIAAAMSLPAIPVALAPPEVLVAKPATPTAFVSVATSVTAELLLWPSAAPVTTTGMKASARTESARLTPLPKASPLAAVADAESSSLTD